MQKRAEGGSGTQARPDEKMGRLHNPKHSVWKNYYSARVRKVKKRVAAKKRRQRDHLEGT